jgi:hypothetical protein
MTLDIVSRARNLAAERYTDIIRDNRGTEHDNMRRRAILSGQCDLGVDVQTALSAMQNEAAST